MSLFKNTLRYFYEISSIPRRSNEEGKIRRYLRKWAKNHHWETEEDEAGNLLVLATTKNSKPKTENSDTLCLQSHLDMVCVSRDSHDWSKKGVTIIEKNNILSGDGTSLGADNGIGVAAMMAVAELKNRPPLELLFTTGEELGLTGAHEIDLEVNANYGINLDWSYNKTIGIGCGGTLFIDCRYTPKKITRKGTPIKIRISGLMGGHSGVDIGKGQGNAIIELTKILQLRKEIIGITDIKGGDANNAIPRSARAIVLYQGDIDVLGTWLEKREQILQKKYNNEDICISVKIMDEEYPFHYEKNILDILEKIGSGVQKSHENKPTSSWNLGEIRLKDGVMKWGYFLRTNTLGGIAIMKKKITKIFDTFPQTNTHTITYELDHETPVWYTDPKSEYIQKIISIINYKNDTKVPAAITHATVEVGILADKYPGTEWVSIGATCHSMHTTREHIYLDDLEEFCQRLERIVTRL